MKIRTLLLALVIPLCFTTALTLLPVEEGYTWDRHERRQARRAYMAGAIVAHRRHERREDYRSERRERRRDERREDRRDARRAAVAVGAAIAIGAAIGNSRR